MRKIIGIAAVAFGLTCFAATPGALAADGFGAQRFGGGVNYWKTIDKVNIADVDDNGFSYIATYQYAPGGILKFEADLELFPNLGGDSGATLAPQAFVIVGGFVYAAAGVGIYYNDSNWGDSPFYMLRAGLDIPVLPRLFLDLNLNYRFNDWESLHGSDLGTDTIRFGAALRFAI